MDWSRAKTYLILTFLLLDALLGYQYLMTQQQAQEYVQSYSTQLQELKDVLKVHKLVLQTDVPRDTPVMRFLQVSHPKQPNSEIVSSSFKDAHVVDSDPNTGTIIYHTAAGEYRITGDGYFAMAYQPSLRIDESDTSPRLSASVLQKIAPTVWHSDLYAADTTSQEDRDHTVVRYLQTYNKYPIFSAMLEVYLQNSQIIGYNQKALEIGSEEENGQSVLSAISALHSITDTLDTKAGVQQTGTIAIRDIKLGYYSPNYEDADVWYLAPMWRIVIGQNIYYVNAFTGQVENGAS